MIYTECNAVDATSTHGPGCEAPQAEGRPKQGGGRQMYINLQHVTADERVAHGCFELELAEVDGIAGWAAARARHHQCPIYIPTRRARVLRTLPRNGLDCELT